MVLADSNEYPALEVLWTMLVVFGMFLWFWLLISVFTDLFRRHDISGWVKVGWSVFVIVLPYIGVLSYLITQGRQMAERRNQEAAAARTAFEHEIQTIAGRDAAPADQIATAKRLLDAGDITREEYEALKRQALGLSGTGSQVH